MLDIRFIRENIELVKEGVKNKNCSIDFDTLISLDDKRRAVIKAGEDLKAALNKANDLMAQKKRAGEDISDAVKELKEKSKSIKELDVKLREINEKQNEILLSVPNIPHVSVPVGSEENNEEVRSWGEIPSFDFKVLDHAELAEKSDALDLKRAAKITGRGFVLYKGMLAKLERALINFMLDIHTRDHGYTEVFPPFLVNRESMIGTGQLPKMEEDMYALKDENLFLIPTAEVPVTNIHRDEVLSENDLPVKYVAYTPCFRREAGSYGKDTKGLSRVHQFDKVEMVQFVKPEESYNTLEALVGNAEKILQELNIPYRVLTLATGDLSFAAAKCYDIEIWAAGMNRWLEVSSCSNFVDFQARRANIKYKSTETKKNQFLHTLNGSGVALARLVIALLENNQQQDGSIVFPEKLQPYLK